MSDEPLMSFGEKSTVKNRKRWLIVPVECTWDPNRRSGNTIPFMSMEAATLTNQKTLEEVGRIFVNPMGGEMEIKATKTGESWSLKAGPFATAFFNASEPDYMGPLQILQRLLELYDAGIIDALPNGNAAPSGEDEGVTKGGEIVAKLMESARIQFREMHNG